MVKSSAMKQELHPALEEIARAQIAVFKWETVYRRCLAELRICSSNSRRGALCRVVARGVAARAV
jgi:hypothetical protein